MSKRTIFEPFRIKMIEPIPVLSYSERCEQIRKAHFNLFKLPASKVTFDFLTDSGTSAMSAAQWAGMMVGDESYAGSTSFEKFEKTVQDLTGCEFVIPTHQGRAAEALLMRALVKPGQIVLGNTHFDTTRANIEDAGAQALDLPCVESKDSQQHYPFKGNIDLVALEKILKEKGSAIVALIMTITNNSVGGQPVSFANLKAAQKLCRNYNKLFFIDAARFAENAWFIKTREPGFENLSAKKISQNIFNLADGVLMSSKKDAFGNIGGFLSLRDIELATLIRNLMVITEGFPTYGGLAGRDLMALSQGLEEVVDENYLEYRVRSTAYLGEGLASVGYKTIQPYGGHAVYIDAAATLPQIPLHLFPGQSLSVFLYERVSVRSVEVGSVMLGRKDQNGKEIPAPKELVRLAIPRRVYTQSHIDYIIEEAEINFKFLKELPGYKFKYEAPVLRHFTAQFEQALI